MNGSSYFQLLNPIILTVFAIGFHAVWRVDRTVASPRLMSLAYFIGALAFTLDFALRDPLGVYWGSYVSNIPFLATVSMTACGMYARAGRPLPIGATLSVSFLTLLGMSFFLFVTPDMTARALAMNFGTGALFALAAFGLRKRTASVDRVLMALLAISALQSVLRPMLVLWVNGLGDIALSYADSFYALALHFCSAIVALSIASVMLFALGSEMVGRLAERSQTDPLPGLLNRRGLEDRLHDMKAGTVLMADIDRFKVVNDTHGHSAGDVVLRSFAATLNGVASSAGADATVARLGGEEFCAILPGLKPAQARLVAEAVRSAFGAMPQAALGGERVTASLGLASWTPVTHEADVANADRALYSAKRAGRDRAVIAGEDGRAGTNVPTVAA